MMFTVFLFVETYPSSCFQWNSKRKRSWRVVIQNVKTEEHLINTNTTCLDCNYTHLLIPSGIHYLRYTSKNPFSRIRAVLILKTRNDVHSRIGPGVGTFK